MYKISQISWILFEKNVRFCATTIIFFIQLVRLQIKLVRLCSFPLPILGSKRHTAFIQEGLAVKLTRYTWVFAKPLRFLSVCALGYMTMKMSGMVLI